MKLTRDDLADLARGAAFLGTGGGRDPYCGRLMVERALDDGCSLEVIDLEDLPDDALVIPTAMMGAPTVPVEKIPRGDEAIRSLQKLEEYLGRKAYATMPIECGGINSTMPLVVGARLGLPVVDVAPGMIGHPTALIVICTDVHKAAQEGIKLDQDQRNTWIGVGAAAQNILLAAEALGLGSCPLTSFSLEGVRTILELPDHLVPDYIVQLGYPTPQKRVLRAGASTRLAVEEISYWETVPHDE